MSHAVKTDTAFEVAKGAAGSVEKERTDLPADHELRDGARLIARGRRSEVMKAARVAHGATVGRVGGEPSFSWCETAGAWVFLGV